jgi:hypothetical protein
MDAEFLILATAGIILAASTLGVLAIGVLFARPCPVTTEQG